MVLATTFLCPLNSSVAANRHTKETLGFNKSIKVKRFRVNCCAGTKHDKLYATKLLGNITDDIIGYKTLTATKSLVDDITERAPAVETLEEPASNPGPSTVCVKYHGNFDPYHATSTPVYQTATFKMKTAKDFGPYSYSRSGNPTRDTLEKLLVKLDHGKDAYCFASGLSALTAVSELVKPGDEILALKDIYGGSYHFLMEYVAKKEGVTVNRVDTCNLEEVREALEPRKTKLVWLESPSNPLQKITDLKAISDLAHEYDAIVMVDNCMMPPLLSQPLDLGVDIVMHSCTKFISGNGNVTGGVLVTKDDVLSDQLKFYQHAMGCALAPYPSWLCLEGSKTMAIRLERQQANALVLAAWLKEQPQVTNVNYVGLPDAPGREIHFRQANGPGSVLSFNTTSPELSEYIVENTQYFSMTVGFGHISSSICLPWFTSHSSVPIPERKAMGITDDLVRISAGIENIEDLIADLDKAFSSFPDKESFWI